MFITTTSTVARVVEDSITLDAAGAYFHVALPSGEFANPDTRMCKRVSGLILKAVHAAECAAMGKRLAS